MVRLSPTLGLTAQWARTLQLLVQLPLRRQRMVHWSRALPPVCQRSLALRLTVQASPTLQLEVHLFLTLLGMVHLALSLQRALQWSPIPELLAR